MENYFCYDVKLSINKKFNCKNKLILTNEDAVSIAKTHFVGADREIMIILMLDSRKLLIGISIISIGTISEILVHPREIFKVAILANSTAIILVHNHPTGNSSPSDFDIETTKQLILAGEILDIKIMDHIIIGECDYFSFQEHAEIL